MDEIVLRRVRVLECLEPDLMIDICFASEVLRLFRNYAIYLLLELFKHCL